MPNKLADHKQRVSFAEDIQVVDALRMLAQKEGKTLTDIYASAARYYLKTQTKPQRKTAPLAPPHKPAGKGKPPPRPKRTR